MTDAVANGIFMNTFGAALVSHQDGLLVDHGQNLRAARLADTAALHALFRYLAERNLFGDGQAIAIRRPSMVRLYSVRAELVDGETKPRVTLFITDIES